MGKSKTIQLRGFPIDVIADDLKRLVEHYTEHATDMMALPLPIRRLLTLRYGSCDFKVLEMERDIVPKPREFLAYLDDVKLYFGCQISKERFSVLWKESDVSVAFGIGMRKWRFSMQHSDKKFKLELSYENIWKIELHQPRGETKTTKYLLIQLIGAPRIFDLDTPTSDDVDNVYKDPLKNYFRDFPDDQWDRAIDFTPCSRIGQSSALCLELPINRDFPNFRENFAHYDESDGQYTLQKGSPFSCNPHVVPMVAPPQGIQIPFDILFKVNSLVQHGCVSGSELNNDFYRLVDPRRMLIVYIEHALEKMYYSKDFCYEPAKWLKDQYKMYLGANTPPRSPTISLDNGLVYIRRAQITPCKVYFCGPEINVSNRVLRHFHEHIDNFLRVSFVDEELDKLYSADLLSTLISERGRSKIYYRILYILRNGLDIGGKKFEFLAFSSSQLRENSLWMFARTTTGLTADSIRAWMGDFSQIRNVAKYAARLGQSFGSSTETLSVSSNEIEIIHDVKVGKYVFSDGIGKISLELASRVAEKCGYNSMPSAFQIRYGGYKGVVAVDPTSSVKLSMRKSMHKYDSDNTKLDVLACSKFQPCYLNRQLITLLSTLGVKDGVFEKKQKEAVDQLNTILTDSTKAQEVLDLMSSGEVTNILKEMLICGYEPNVEPFLSMMLQTFRASKLLELRQKTRIFIPKGRAMMGVLDETRTLEYGEVFVQYSNNRLNNICHVVKDVPDLRHMVDCVVFPQKGERPHPNECSGSDLDGDIYFVCWDSELVPPRTIHPMEYDTAPPILLDHDVEIKEVQKYFANYIVNDSLGIIANAHTVFADKEPGKALSEPCVELANLFSTAVDFPKTGIPAEIPRHLFAKEYPDFMEKLDKPTYKSKNVIGKLFREIQGISTKDGSITSFTSEVAKKSYDPDMEMDGFMDYVDDAFYYKTNYDYRLGNLMDYYGIKTESEILSGNIIKMSKSFTKRRDADAISKAVSSLRKEARSWFNEGGTDVDSGSDDAYAKASAWYYVTYHHSFYGMYNEGMQRDHFLSFPWCVYHLLVQIKKANARTRMHASME
ncbi:RNA-dependent RNA polymerase [Trifolium repens]|nr:RNA-dependent RNA polymerase [Trifolium repens]